MSLGNVSIRTWHEWQKPSRTIGGLLVMLLLGAIIWSITAYTGDRLILLAFHIAFWVMLLLAFPKRRFDGYLFLAVFLFLGFWLKFMAHLALHYDFIEPVGRFDGTPALWDRSLGISAAGATGVALCRAVHLLICRWRDRATVTPTNFVPVWYSRFRFWIWVICAIGAVGLYAANYFFAFFQIGVNMRLILPFDLSVLFAWASFAGIPMLFALMLDWELETNPRQLMLVIATVATLSVVASVSILSRAVTLFLVLAYATAISIHMPSLRRRLWSGYGWRLPVILAVSLVFSLSIVSWIRLVLYVPTESPTSVSQLSLLPQNAAHKLLQVQKISPAPTEDAQSIAAVPPLGTGPTAIAHRSPPSWRPPAWLPPALAAPVGMGRQVILLSLDRWIGLEGVLSVASSPDRLGWALFKRGLNENASVGVNSIYQSLSNSYYIYDRNFTFLTLPGAIAILFYSGSLTVVLIGMFLISGIIILFEELILRLCGGRFLATVTAIFMANAVCQMNFPYLWIVFLGENLVAVFAFYSLRALSTKFKKISTVA
ncbi:hypothetical protein [Burkholderia sp. L27(2015)]|uniref:hypothetical protein n=1 Tax=Burkholderia sp. L27(2015) TaxID=1641858 RepID=UPI00131AEC29|nr:hypothetical protein [Burkholderia sp. L27(2015)]